MYRGGNKERQERWEMAGTRIGVKEPVKWGLNQRDFTCRRVPLHSIQAYKWQSNGSTGEE